MTYHSEKLSAQLRWRRLSWPRLRTDYHRRDGPAQLPIGLIHCRSLKLPASFFTFDFQAEQMIFDQVSLD